MKATKDGRLAVEIDKKDNDADMKGWIDKKGKWTRVFDNDVLPEKDGESDFADHDSLIREIVSFTKESAGWVIFKDNEWIAEPISHVKMRLQRLGMGKPEAEAVMGGAISKSWTLVNQPFQAEYPGGRTWNKDAARLVYEPAVLDEDELPYHPHWDLILKHAGQSLDKELSQLPWRSESA